MKNIQVFSFLLIVWTSSAIANDAVERIYSAGLLPNPLQQSSVWRSLDRTQLPEPFNDAESPIAQSAFHTGFALAGTRTIVVFEFLKPLIVSGTQYCRSTVNLFQFYDYDPDVDYLDLPYSAITGFAELVDFEPSLPAGSQQCSYPQLDDLSEFVVIDVQTTGPQLKQIWETFESLRSTSTEANCHFSQGASLVTVGLPVINAQVEDYFSLIIKDGGSGSSVVRLVSTTEGLTVDQCFHGMLD